MTDNNDQPDDTTDTADAQPDQGMELDLDVEPGPENGEPGAEETWKDAGGEVENKGPGILGRIALVLKMWIVVPLTFFLKFVPRSDGIADTLIMAGLRYKKKLAKADGVTFVIYDDGQIVPRANRWVSSDRQYVTENGEELSAAGEGHRPYYMGKTPVTFALRSAPEVFEPVLAFFAQKADLGEGARVEFDGGHTDVIVDNSVPGGGDGMMLSWEKAWELYAQKISQEDLDEQYRMGYLDGVEEDGTLGPMKTLLIFGAGAAMTLAIIFVLGQLSGGGSVLPMVLAPGVF